MAQHHVWSSPDSKGVKHCLYEGCTVRTRRAYAEWQQRPRAPWVSIISADIPRCLGVPPTEGR